MTTDLRALALEILGTIAPEADLAALADDADLRETLDLDSMDFLAFVTALHKRTGHSVPEADYPRLFTLGGAIRYLGG